MRRIHFWHQIDCIFHLCIDILAQIPIYRPILVPHWLQTWISLYWRLLQRIWHQKLILQRNLVNLNTQFEALSWKTKKIWNIEHGTCIGMLLQLYTIEASCGTTGHPYSNADIRNEFYTKKISGIKKKMNLLSWKAAKLFILGYIDLWHHTKLVIFRSKYSYCIQTWLSFHCSLLEQIWHHRWILQRSLVSLKTYFEALSSKIKEIWSIKHRTCSGIQVHMLLTLALTLNSRLRLVSCLLILLWLWFQFAYAPHVQGKRHSILIDP